MKQPNCKYSDDALRDIEFTYTWYDNIALCGNCLVAVQRKYESLRRLWLEEEKGGYEDRTKSLQYTLPSQRVSR